jgi:DNA-binding transcriptional MerR regulator
MKGGSCDGDKKLYKIGELAKLAEVSTRTIDYYTNIGIIKPEKRSKNNYRLYSDETLTRLKRIEQMKREKYTLDEIKQVLNDLDKMSKEEQVTEKLTALQLHLMQLEKEAKEISPLLKEMKPKQIKYVYKHLTPRAAACIEALLVLIDKNYFLL